MKISKQQLYSYLEYLHLSGEAESKEALLNINKDQIRALVLTPTRALAVRATLKGEFSDIGSVGIDDVVLLEKLINSTRAEDIDIKIASNKLNIQAANTKINARLRDPQYIINKVEEEKFNGLVDKAKGNSFALTVQMVERIKTYVSAINSPTLVLKGAGKKLELVLENNENEIVTSFELDKEVEAFNVCISAIFINLLTILKTDSEISIKNDNPIFLRVIDGNSTIEYIIAPYQKK